MKTVKLWMAISIALVFFSFASCSSGDDDNEGIPPSSVAGAANTAIKQVFPNHRLDSIDLHSDSYGNTKISYDGDYLIEYGAYYSDGKVYDEDFYQLKWNKNDVEIYWGAQDTPRLKAVFGNNGFVKECLNADGSVCHSFEYDAEGHLIKYNQDNSNRYSTPDYWELQWENGNLISAIRYYFKQNGSSSDGYIQYTYTYTKDTNSAGLLFHANYSYGWLQGMNGLPYIEALYYAGILGKGTKNLIESAKYKYENGQTHGTNTCQYTIVDGVVTNCLATNGNELARYFYK